VEFQRACLGVVFMTIRKVHSDYSRMFNVCLRCHLRWNKLYYPFKVSMVFLKSG